MNRSRDCRGLIWLLILSILCCGNELQGSQSTRASSSIRCGNMCDCGNSGSFTASDEGVPSLSLESWFRAHDVLYSRVSIRIPENGVRGIFADEDIPPRYPIAVIPARMIIRPLYSDLAHLLSACGSHLDTKTRLRLQRVCCEVPSALGIDDACLLLAFRLLELLHTNSATWLPYRERERERDRGRER
jgi:hypothetical protein